MQAVVARLSAAQALVDGGVHRARRRPLPDSVSGMINVYLGGSLPTRGSIVGAPIDWITAVRLEAIARGDASTTGDQAALALHQKAWERLFGTPSLDGLVMDMEPGAIVSDEDEADTQIGVVTGTVQVMHRTAAYSLEPQP